MEYKESTSTAMIFREFLSSIIRDRLNHSLACKTEQTSHSLQYYHDLKVISLLKQKSIALTLMMMMMMMMMKIILNIHDK